MFLKNFFNKSQGKTLYSAGWSSPVSTSGEIITTENALGVSAIYSAINVKANAIAKLGLMHYIKTDNGRQKVTDHQISYLLSKRPNPYMTPFVFYHTMTVHRNLFGICYVRMEIDKRGTVVALHILNSGRVSVVEDAGGTKFYVDGTDPANPEVYDENSILRFPYMTVDGFTPKSPISVAREQAGNIMKQQKFMGGFYKNGANLGGIIKLPQKIEKNAKDKVRQAYQDAIGGDENAGKLLMLEPGFEYQSFEMPLKDAEFINSMKFNITDIARIFNVPPHMIGDLENANFNSLEQMNMSFVINTLMPECKAVEEEMDYKLFTKKEQQQGNYVRFNMSSMLRGDSAARSTYYNNGLSGGWLNINQIRQLEEMNSIGEHGDIHRVDLNHVSVEIADEYQLGRAKGGE